MVCRYGPSQTQGGSVVLLITKGMVGHADGRLEMFPRYLGGKRPDVSFLAVGGPCICFELFDRQHTLVSFCGREIDGIARVKEMLATGYYHIVPTTDVIGLECGVALKNAYAMGASLAIGLAEHEKGIADVSGDSGHLCSRCP